MSSEVFYKYMSALPLVEVEEYNKSLTLEYYQEVFEGPFLHETGQYYRQQASKLVAESSCSEYMHCVVSMLQTARRRGTSFLHQTSVTKVSRQWSTCMYMCVKFMIIIYNMYTYSMRFFYIIL